MLPFLWNDHGWNCIVTSNLVGLLSHRVKIIKLFSVKNIHPTEGCKRRRGCDEIRLNSFTEVLIDCDGTCWFVSLSQVTGSKWAGTVFGFLSVLLMKIWYWHLQGQTFLIIITFRTYMLRVLFKQSEGKTNIINIKIKGAVISFIRKILKNLTSHVFFLHSAACHSHFTSPTYLIPLTRFWLGEKV